MYKAIFIDLDGTLIRKDHSLSPYTIETIRRVKKAGYLVALVSARPLFGMESIAKALDLTSGPLASLNGAYISVEGQILVEDYIPASLVKGLHQRVRHFNPSIIYYHKGRWFSDRHDYYTDYEQRITHVPVTIQPFEQTLLEWENENTGPNKILVVTREDQMEDMRNTLSLEFSGELNLANSKPIYLEVMGKGASKLKAIQWMMQHFGIEREEVIAIGDNFNDQEMIQFAGCGIAMGNAPKEIREIADYVTATNNEDGVARALTEILAL